MRPLLRGVAQGLVVAVTSLGLALAAGCACGPATQAPPQDTGATVIGNPAVTEPNDTAPGDAAAASRTEVVLLRVVDGDTIWVRMADGSEEKVRYIGIDAPEIAHNDSPGEYLGDEATSHNAELLGSGPLSLELDVEERDDFGRLLAYVWAGDVFINERLVLDGYARAHSYPPNLSRQPQLQEAQRKAYQAGVGLWAPTTTAALLLTRARSMTTAPTAAAARG